MNMNAALEVTGLTKTYPGSRKSTPVVAARDIGFSIDPGASLGLVGESGSGKTTVARMIVGLLAQDSGSIAINNRERGRVKRGNRARLERAKEAQMVFQDPYGSLDRRLSVDATLRDTLRRHRRGVSAEDISREVSSLMDRVGLATIHADSRPHQLSGGQRQRVAIAKALAVKPTVLVLDEAVSALDVSVQAQILRLLNEIRAESKVCLVFVTHDLAVVGQVTDQTLVMYQGQAVEQGPTSEMLRNPRHPYTEMLLSSAPGPGWQPERVAELRAEFTKTLRHHEKMGALKT